MEHTKRALAIIFLKFFLISFNFLLGITVLTVYRIPIKSVFGDSVSFFRMIITSEYVENLKENRFCKYFFN